MKRLLLWHPDQDVYSAVERTLSRIGVSTDVVGSADDILLHLGAQQHAVVVVDRILADKRLGDILDSLRGRTSPKPIVIVTSTDDPDLDPTIVSLVVPPGYDVSALVGVILACATESPIVASDDATASEKTAG